MWYDLWIWVWACWFNRKTKNLWWGQILLQPPGSTWTWLRGNTSSGSFQRVSGSRLTSQSGSLCKNGWSQTSHSDNDVSREWGLRQVETALTSNPELIQLRVLFGWKPWSLRDLFYFVLKRPVFPGCSLLFWGWDERSVYTCRNQTPDRLKGFIKKIIWKDPKYNTVRETLLCLE